MDVIAGLILYGFIPGCIILAGYAARELQRRDALRFAQENMKPPSTPTTGNVEADKVKRSFIHHYWAWMNSPNCPYHPSRKVSLMSTMREMNDPIFWITAREMTLSSLLFHIQTGGRVSCVEKLSRLSNCSSSLPSSECS